MLFFQMGAYTWSVSVHLHLFYFPWCNFLTLILSPLLSLVQGHRSRQVRAQPARQVDGRPLPCHALPLQDLSSDSCRGVV